MRFKRLNVLRSQCHLHSNVGQPVSDDEAESPIPDLSAYMSIPCPTTQAPTLPVTPAHNPTVPDNIALGIRPADLAPHASANIPPILPDGWQSLLTDKVVQSHVADTLSSKPIMIDYQNHGPIYNAEDLA